MFVWSGGGSRQAYGQTTVVVVRLKDCLAMGQCFKSQDDSKISTDWRGGRDVAHAARGGGRCGASKYELT